MALFEPLNFAPRRRLDQFERFGRETVEHQRCEFSNIYDGAFLSVSIGQRRKLARVVISATPLHLSRIS